MAVEKGDNTGVPTDTLAHVLLARAESAPDQLGYAYLRESGSATDDLTYRALYDLAAGIAAALTAVGAPGDRVLVLSGLGPHFTGAFFGCMLAGRTPVPVAEPRGQAGLKDLAAIAEDCAATAILAPRKAMADLKAGVSADVPLTRLHWLPSDEPTGEQLADPVLPAADDIAFLQYTSGSTGMPRGVIVRHANVMHNLAVIKSAFRHSPETKGVIWLPPHHDMGLIGGILQPLYLGIPVVLLSPTTLLRDPLAWLRAISDHRATTSGGPNFCYDYCVRKVSEADAATLDLSSWDVAFTGAEPINPRVLERFGDHFAAAGFRRGSFLPCYGLAESTLFVSGSPQGTGVRTVTSEGRELVSCGTVQGGSAVIVDPDTLEPREDGQVGEIWLSGPSVAGGYWNRPDETAETFHADLAGTPHLRTGDLGFVHDGELVVSGRLKELIIIRGRNVFPHDVERSVEAAHPTLRRGGCAVVSVEADGEERLVVLQEVDRRTLDGDLEDLESSIRQAVSSDHALDVHRVVFLRPGQLPKTTSGKPRRLEARARFALDTDPLTRLLDPATLATKGDQPLTALGLDSIKVVELNTYLQNEFGYTIPPERLFGGLTIAELAAELSTRERLPAAQPAPGAPAAEVAAQAAEAQAAEVTAAPKAAVAPAPATPAAATAAPAAAQAAPPAAAAAQAAPPAAAAQAAAAPARAAAAAPRRPKVEFSVFFFASDAERDHRDKYGLFLEAAQFADRNGFHAVWSPERHFHRFGGLFPNPSVVSAALAVTTKQIRIRAGSVVLPLHNPVRTAEEWAVVDNLSHGRVDLAFATGWNPDDFALSPGTYETRQQALHDGIDQVRRLWRGETVSLPNGKGSDIDVRVYPAPIQSDVPTWITCSGGVERFEQAGQLGANVLTALLFQDVDELGTKLDAYREARAAHGHDPHAGRVTLMLHTYLGPDDDTVRDVVEVPFKNYLRDSVDLWRRGSTALDSLSEAQQTAVLNVAFERYFHSSALFGTPDRASAMVERLAAAGVDEIACLVDFGLDKQQVLDGLRHLTVLKDRWHASGIPAAGHDLGSAVRNRLALAHRNAKGVLQKARDFDLAQRLESQGLLPFYPDLSDSDGATCDYQGRRIVMLGSNNYLGLTADRRVREAAAAASLADGPSVTGSRLMNGSTPAHTTLERELAGVLGREDALLFTTGYQANIGLLSAFMTEGTALVVDEECHASIYDGAAVGGCRLVQFRHNDLADLDRRLAGLDSISAMVMVDGVYSMSGDIAPLPDVKAICDRYGIPLALDDAHGLGMVGATGRGVEEELGAIGMADVLTGTFSKSLASIGGWLAGPRNLMDWVRYYGRSMLFSASIPPPAVAAASAALKILVAEPDRVARLRELSEYWRRGLVELGFDTGTSRTVIVPVIVGDELLCMRFAQRLLELGVYANCVMAPAVPAGRAMLRTTVTAVHEKAHLDRGLDAFATAGSELGVTS